MVLHGESEGREGQRNTMMNLRADEVHAATKDTSGETDSDSTSVEARSLTCTLSRK